MIDILSIKHSIFFMKNYQDFLIQSTKHDKQKRTPKRPFKIMLQLIYLIHRIIVT